MEAYGELVKRFTKIYRFNHINSIIGWDTMVNVSKKGGEARAAATAELKLMLHGLITDPALSQLLEKAKAGEQELSTEEKANLREMTREWKSECLLPADLVEKKSVAVSKAQEAWQKYRGENDWESFKPFLRDIVQYTRQEAELLAKDSGLKKYDALMDRYEPGARMESVDKAFADVKEWLPELIQKVMAQNADVKIIEPVGPFPIEKQKALGVECMKAIGFDFDSGRLDVSSHPFCGGVSEDVRLTTRYYENDFTQSLMGIIHETGHSKYEQNRPKHIITQPASQARSMGIHESQSLFQEMQIARSPKFMGYLTGLVEKHLGKQDAFTVENLTNLYRRVKPDYIRVDADELCYPLHVILRYEIERALIEDDMDIEKIPEMWDSKMKEYLGIDTVGNFKDGCMQDIHWSVGYLGYFPTYTLGAMYAAQLMAALRRDLGSDVVDAKIAEGDLAAITEWLNDKIWSQGSLLTTDELMTRATGEPLNAKFYREHLTARYLEGLR